MTLMDPPEVMDRNELSAMSQPEGWMLAGWLPVEYGQLLIADPTYVLPYAERGEEGLDASEVTDNPAAWHLKGVQPVGHTRDALIVQNIEDGTGLYGTYPLYVRFGPDSRVQAAMVDFSGDGAASVRDSDPTIVRAINSVLAGIGKEPPING